LISVNLKARGYQVEQAHDGLEGLQRLRRNPPQAVVVDLMLPKLDGWSLLREMDADPALAKIPVIVITGAVVGNQVLRYSNIVEVFSKPIKIAQLLQVIKRHVGPQVSSKP
jgi:CheY-like chemotaxis protein